MTWPDLLAALGGQIFPYLPVAVAIVALFGIRLALGEDRLISKTIGEFNSLMKLVDNTKSLNARLA